MAPKKKKLTKQQKKFKRQFKRQFKKKQDENPNLSGALSNIAKSFFRKNLAPEDPLPPFEETMLLAMMGWNHSLLPEERQRNVYDSLEDTLPSEFGVKGVSTVVDLIDKFATEKRLLYPNVMRKITDPKFKTNELGEKALEVSFVDIEEKS